MNKKANVGRLSLICSVLIILVVAVVLGNSLRRTAHVTLPTDTTDTEQGTDSDLQENSAVNAISVTPQTVQTIVETLERSDYRHTLRIEQLWSGGSGTREITVTKIGDFQRIDELLTDGRIQHIVATPNLYYLWLDDVEPVYESPIGDFTVDQLQGIPTYEDVLALDVDAITHASYEALSGVRCIYVETAADAQGYQSRYWIGVDSGLLMAAERLEGQTTIYRMAVVSEEPLASAETYFTLPSGIDVSA